jgi:hypothetical protein
VQELAKRRVVPTAEEQALRRLETVSVLLASLVLAVVGFVPLDDRPVNLQLPVMLGRIAGIPIETPSRNLLGKFLVPGRPDAIAAWIDAEAGKGGADAIVVSADMLAYGGLIASRVPGPSYEDVSTRLMTLRRLRAKAPRAWISVFGTVMRLAPTSVPAGSGYFAAYPTGTYLAQYANLMDPPAPDEIAVAKNLRASIGSATLEAYLATRSRNLAVDRLLLQMTGNGTIDRLVIGQDDAGTTGLHVKELRALQAELAEVSLAQHASLEPGADDLGMILVAHALARHAKWSPRVGVRYSAPGGSSYRDPLEYGPISTAIDGLIAAVGGTRNDDDPEIHLYVRVPNTSTTNDDSFASAMARDLAAGRSVALADISFSSSYRDQAAFARRILASRLASRLDAYASWNTNANTVGTALAEAIAAGAGRRMGSYDPTAHRTFTFVRFLDDYEFHDEIRPDLSASLARLGIGDETPLSASLLASATAVTLAKLRKAAGPILTQLDPGYRLESLSVELPWNRTFEAAIETRIAR